jgi:hypothetical protein
MDISRGSFAVLNDLVCVVVGVDGDPNVPDDHVALWYGDLNETGNPQVWTVPAEYIVPFDKLPEYLH